jgi:hypothetical protein
MKSKTQAMIPEEFLKKLLPNNPSRTNPARGNNGINGV